MNDEIMFHYGRFVNRHNELKDFCSILEKNDFSVMVIYGEEGIGKTALKKRLIYECREVRKMHWAETFRVDKTRIYNYLTIMRMIRNKIGEEFFQPFTDLLNYYTKTDYNLQLNVEPAGQIKMLENADLKDVTVNQIVGQKIEIHDLYINTPREDKMIREEERMHRLTQQFLKDLTGALGNQQIVILIDDVELMLPETQSWLWSELVRGVLDQGLANIRFVFCVDKEPELDDFLKEKVHRGKLKVLSEKYVIEYLNKRQVGTEIERQTIASMIMAEVQGNPRGMADMVDRFIERQQRKQKEELDE